MAEAQIAAWAAGFGPAAYAGLGNRRSERQPRSWPAARSVADLLAFYPTSTLQMLAVNTITSAVLKDRLVWRTEAGDEMPDQPVEPAIWHFVREAIRSLAIAGFIVWRVGNDGRPELAGLDAMTVAWNREEQAWVPYAINQMYRGTSGWLASFSHRPLPAAWRMVGDGPPSPVTLPELRSGCAAAWDESHRVAVIERHWLRRDAHNSQPGCFTVVTNELGLPWARASDTGSQLGRTVAGGGSTGSGLLQGVGSFTDLIHKRAEKISRMEDFSQRDQARVTTRQQFEAYADDASGNFHSEHVVTDGKNATETKILLSMADAPFVYQRARHQAMTLLGVPPQSIGESVNSERTAAHHKQFATALEMFKQEVAMYRGALSVALRGGDTGPHIGFSHCLTSMEIDTVCPLMKVDEAIEAFSCTFGIDESKFDRERVMQWQDAALGASGDDSVTERTITNHLQSGTSSE